MEDVKKVCSCCKQEKNISDFGTRKSTPDNLYYYCKDCAKTKEKLRREKDHEKYLKDQTKYRNENKEKFTKSIAKWQKENHERCLKNGARWREENRERYLEDSARYKRENRERMNKLSAEYNKRRRKIDPLYRLRSNVRSRLWQALKHQGATKSKRTMILVGCSPQELKIHLESLFTEGMTWENRGNKGWHIDHKEPCAKFNLADPEEQKKCFHYTNLQPLWAEENIKKSSLYEGKKYFHKEHSL